MNRENPIKQTNETRRPELVSGPQKAFTLAEVLITLAIIGVVAALTIPTVVKNYQKQQTVVKLKKVYNTINQVFQMAQAQHGVSQTWSFADKKPGAERNDYVLENYIFPHLKIMKNCGSEPGSCLSTAPRQLNNTSALTYLVGTDIHAFFIAADGSSYVCWVGRYLGVDNHIYFWVDLDGPNAGQNKMGRDIFGLYIRYGQSMKNGVFMVGWQNEYYTCDNRGLYCASKILHDGWQIKDDYPW